MTNERITEWAGIPIYESDLIPKGKVIALYRDYKNPATFKGYCVNNIKDLETELDAFNDALDKVMEEK